MAWPPPVLPTNFQNATASLDTHPAAHNNVNVAINNDIVPKINEIDSHLNGDLPNLIQYGTTLVTLDDEGLGTITFPRPFATFPTMTATVQLLTVTQRTVQINGLTATTATIRCFANGVPETGGENPIERMVHWVAAGIAP